MHTVLAMAYRHFLSGNARCSIAEHLHSLYKYPIQSGSIALNFLGSTATATKSTTV
jgi:hypothetical protein